MPAQPVCPYCRAKLFPHEVTNDECASCHGRLSAAVEWVPPARETDGPAPPPDVPFVIPPDLSNILANRPPPEAFAAVRLGITLVQWGFGLTLVFAALATLSSFDAPATPMNLGREFLLALALFGKLFQVPSAGMALLGVCFCCSTPKGCANDVMLPLVICLLAIVPLSLPVVALFDVHPEAWAGETLMADWSPKFAVAFLLPTLAVFASAICFFLLLAELARFFGDRCLARHFGALCGLSLLVAVLDMLVRFVGPPATAGYVSVFEPEMYSLKSAAPYAELAIRALLTVWFLLLLNRLNRLVPIPPDR